ncbi:MAG: hypothetical protein EZS28_043863, partial [Streblomastix strix]
QYVILQHGQRRCAVTGEEKANHRIMRKKEIISNKFEAEFITGNVFANEFFEIDILETKDHYITETALWITVGKQVHFDSNNNTFRYLKLDGDSRSAPPKFVGWSLYMKVRGNIFEDNLNFGTVGTIISLIDGGLGQLQDYFSLNRIIINKERQDPPSRTYVANGHDYSLEMGEPFNHLYFGSEIIPDRYYTEDVIRSDLQEYHRQCR